MTREQKKESKLFAKMRKEAKTTEERTDVEIKISRIIRFKNEALRKSLKQ